MRHVQLQAFDDDYGNLGLVVVGTPLTETTMADTCGGLIAHDLLEHQNGVDKIGCPADEIEALGGLWQVRGRHGDFCLDNPNVGSAWNPERRTILELANLARDVPFSDWTPYIGQYNTRPHHEDETFRDMLDWVRPNVLAELYEEDRSTFPIDAFLENALHLLRTGYRKAERRFGCGFEGLDTFKAIKSAVSPHARDVESNHWNETDRHFRLSYGRGEAKCVEITHLCA